jgi:hypothetical protein
MWLDNRTAILASDFVGIGLNDKVECCNKNAAKYVHVKRPKAVKMYNKSMGGVDLLDQLVGLYRIFIRSKK